MAVHNINGARAEKRTAEYLESAGYKIIGRNWKTKWCEVDIVAEKGKCVYFVEVKYRTSPDQGGGFEYITPRKLRKMELAARSWVEINGWQGEYTLSAAEVSGPDFEVEFIEEILT
ncbi:MAG TPA: YraN family protein [Candidatus Saccharimonadales bacterium]|nr:YraN family protein [Candidatus Saccharimonadales bacterium]